MKEHLQKILSYKKHIILLLVSLTVIAGTFITISSINNSKIEKNEKVVTDMKTLQSAAYNVGVLNNGFTNDVNLLAEQLNSSLFYTAVTVKNNTITTVEKDPWGNEYQIQATTGSNGAGQLDIVSAGPDKQFNTNDDVRSTLVCQQTDGQTNITVVEPEISKDYETSHVCLFNQKVEKQEFLKTTGTCIAPTTYYYSCVCGQKSTATFATTLNSTIHAGDKVKTYSTNTEDMHYVYTHCTACKAELDTKTEMHNYNIAKICENCFYAAHIHNFNIKDTANEYLCSTATCKLPTSYYYSCSCKAKGESVFYVGNALEHKMTTTTIKATCTAPGKTIEKCSDCGTIIETVIPVLEHNFVQVEKDSTKYMKATCHTYAQYYETCKDCGVKGDKLFDGTVFDSQNHEGDTRLVYDYTDDEKHVVNTYCDGCNMSIHKEVLPHEFDSARNCILCKNHIHDYSLKDNVRIKSEATCQDPAQYYYNCVCGEVGSMSYEYGNIDKANHTGDVVFAGTVNSHTINSCCGTLVSSDHDMKENIQKQANCQEEGLAIYTCECGYSYEKVLPILSHNYVEIVSPETMLKAATCVSSGEYYYSCSACKHISSETFFTEFNTNNHSSAANISYEALDDGKHYIHARCVDCNALVNTTTEQHAFHGENCTLCQKHIHNFKYQDNIQLSAKANCLEPAKYYYNCSCGLVCDETYDWGQINPNNHAAEVKLVGKEFVHSEYSCCGTVELKDHFYQETITKEPTCMDTGIMVLSCECGYEYKVELERLPHNFVEMMNDISEKAPATCTTPAEFYLLCDACYVRADKTFFYGDPNPDNHVGDETTKYVESSAYNEHIVQNYCDSCQALKSEYPKEHILNDMNDCIFCNVHRHQYTEMDNLFVKSEANCTSEAVYYYNCVCGEAGDQTYTFGEINKQNHIGTTVPAMSLNVCQTYTCCGTIAVEKHDFKTTIVEEATCTNKGHVKYNCDCGFSYEDSISVIPHEFKDVVDSKYLQNAPTCVSPAIYHQSCVCGQQSQAVFSYGDVDASNHGNLYNKYSFYSDSYHTKLTVCADCGYTSNEVLEDHSFDSTMNCTVCETHTHNFVNEVIHDRYLKQKLGCTTPSQYYYSCVCGDASQSFFDYEQPLGHDPIFCGNEEIHKYCKYCKFVIEDASYHAMKESIVEEATCTKPGTKKLTCECGYSYTQSIPQTAHNYNQKDNIHLISKATCKRNAMYYYNCKCGAAGTASYFAANTKLNHDYSAQLPGDNTLLTKATCTTPATYIYSCVYCNMASPDQKSFSYGYPNAANHTGLYKKYSLINEVYHDYLSVCADCGEEEGPVQEKHVLTATSIKNQYVCSICNLDVHVHDYSNNLIKATYLYKEATCINPISQYFKSCDCGAAGKQTFDVEEVGDHVETMIATSDTHSKCELCGTVWSSHEFEIAYRLCDVKTNSELIHRLKEVYGTGSKVYFSTYAATQTLRYMTTVKVAGQDVVVYVSEKPPVSPEMSLQEQVGDNIYTMIAMQLREAFGRESGVVFSLQPTSNTRYSTVLTINGSSRTVYLSTKPNEPLSECTNIEKYLKICSCGYEELYMENHGHVISGSATCTEPARCMYCHAPVVPAHGHSHVVRYEYHNILNHYVITGCRYCDEVFDQHTESHSAWIGTCEICGGKSNSSTANEDIH